LTIVISLLEANRRRRTCNRDPTEWWQLPYCQLVHHKGTGLWETSGLLLLWPHPSVAFP